MNGPGPCNGYPEYKDLPINQGFYLGAHDAELNDISKALSDGKESQVNSDNQSHGIIKLV